MYRQVIDMFTVVVLTCLEIIPESSLSEAETRPSKNVVEKFSVNTLPMFRISSVTVLLFINLDVNLDNQKMTCSWSLQLFHDALSRQRCHFVQSLCRSITNKCIVACYIVEHVNSLICLQTEM